MTERKLPEQVVVTGKVPGGIAVLVVWNTDWEQCTREWDLAVQTLAAAGYTEGLEDPALSMMDGRGELYIATKPVQQPAMPAEWLRGDEAFGKLLDSLTGPSHMESLS